MKIPLILVSNSIRGNCCSGASVAELDEPRNDCAEIARHLGAEMVGADPLDGPWYPYIHRVERYVKLNIVESMFVSRRWAKYDAILSTSEKVAIPLALLIPARKRREVPHVLIGHKLSSPRKSLFFRLYPPQKAFSRVICLCRTQADYAVNELGFPESRVHFVYDKVDHQFFRPAVGAADEYVLAVGREQRDYRTLVRALAGTKIRLVIVASSPWSTWGGNHDGRLDSESVTVHSHISFNELRSLYARARLVVIPLFDVDYAAGVNSVLEAMAMAKPLVVSRSRGIQDYVMHGETGLYVPPEDEKALRETVLDLWERPHERQRLGTNARQAVEEKMNLDRYVDEIVQIMQKVR